MRSRLSVALTFFAMLALFWALVPPPHLAHAQEAPSFAFDLDPTAYAAGAIEAAQGGDWGPLIVLALIGAVWLVRELALSRTPAELPERSGIAGWLQRHALRAAVWLRGDRGGALLAFVLAMLGGVASAQLAGQPLSLSLLVTTLGVGVKAIGGYVAFRKLFGLRRASPPAPELAHDPE